MKPKLSLSGGYQTLILLSQTAILRLAGPSTSPQPYATTLAGHNDRSKNHELLSTKRLYDNGDRFERLMLHAFRTDRTFRQQFSEVWRWMDWPGRGSLDIGIDLVARDLEGRLTAIQCKCYAPTATLIKEEIDSFRRSLGAEAVVASDHRGHYRPVVGKR